MFESLIRFIREQYRTEGPIPLHAPVFWGREREFVLDAIDSTYVSSVGAYVDRFEREVAAYTGCARAVATVNGTAALHVALRLAGVSHGDLVLTQPLTFVATCNAISYCGADPIFVDVERDTLGLSPAAMDAWLHDNARLDDADCISVDGGRPIRACVPMHTFGHPADLHGLMEVCAKWNIALVEDAAESLGSLYRGRHTGTFGLLGVLSFNGNKLLTTGGGGMILADELLGARAKHVTTTAKLPHEYEYRHDEQGYNYRMPNLNAALGCAQLEQLELFIAAKRALAARYADFLVGASVKFVTEPQGCRSNYWLNAVICEDLGQRNALLERTNVQGVMTRPVWTPMHRLAMYAHCRSGALPNAEWLEARLVNLPSSVPFEGVA